MRNFYLLIEIQNDEFQAGEIFVDIKLKLENKEKMYYRHKAQPELEPGPSWVQLDASKEWGFSLSQPNT